MKHNLAEINAALRLGDRFVPPVGAVLVSDPIIFSSTLYPEAVLRVVAGPSSDIADMFWVNVLGNNRKECVSITEPLTGWATYVLQPVDILEILSVPSGVPPFTEWPRAKK